MMGEPEVVDPEPLSAARLKVQRTNWHKLAGNELMKIQNKIQTDRQKKIKEKWESNRLKNLEVMKQRAEDDAGLSPHPADVIRKYNYKIRPNTQPVRFGKKSVYGSLSMLCLDIIQGFIRKASSSRCHPIYPTRYSKLANQFYVASNSA